MVRNSTPSTRILQSSIAAFALILSAANPVFAGIPDADNDVANVVDGASVLIDVLANDSDSENASLQIISVGSLLSPAKGSAVIEGNKIRYSAPLGSSGVDEFSYGISSGGATAYGYVTVNIANLGLPSATVNLYAKRSGGSEVPGAGVPDSNIPEGAAFTGFGIPSINDNDEVAVLGRFKAPGEKGASIGVFAGSPLKLIAKRGDVAPDHAGEPEEGVIFASFRDPLLSPNGKVAFLAKLAGDSITSSSANALFSDAFDGKLLRLIQSGDEAPGIPGATIRKITSVVLGSRELGEPDSNTIFFTAALTIAGDVNRSNDSVLYSVSQEVGGTTITPVVREGSEVGILRGGGVVDTKVVKNFRALVGRPGSPGQGRGVINSKFYVAWGPLLLTDSTGVKGIYTHRLGLLGYDANGFETGNQVPTYPEGVTWASFGLPTQSEQNELAFFAKLKGAGITSSNNTGIFTVSGNNLYSVASEGDEAPGIEGATFSLFKDPVSASGGRVAFAARVKGPESTEDQGIWYRDANGLDIVAREGAQAVGVASGGKWASFSSLALSGGTESSLLFVGKLARPKSGDPNPADIRANNSTGLWARDAYGRLHLVARYGDQIEVGGEDKTLRSFVALRAVNGSPAQSRYFNNNGKIFLRALCSDGTQALVGVEMPSQN